MDAKSALSFARENECAMADLLYTDLAGRLRRVGVPLLHLSPKVFEEGIPLGRDERGDKLVLVPDPATGKIDPFAKAKTIGFIGEARLAQTLDSHPLDPRGAAKRAAALLKNSGVAEVARFGAEPQFFICDDVRFDQTKMSSFHIIESVEGPWNSGREENPNLGYKGRTGGGANLAAPFDAYADLRQEAVGELMKMGVGVEREVKGPASAGQGEIVLRHAPLVEAADNVVWLKYVLRNTAVRNQKTITFMPCPLEGEPASSMHVSQSLWLGQKNLFGENGQEREQAAAHYLGGLDRHAAALSALLRPTVNSYRVPLFAKTGPLASFEGEGSKAARVECSIPDPSANPYLAFAALLCAGLDGIKEKIKRPARQPALPQNLEAALSALKRDCAFLAVEGVFGEEILSEWLRQKRENEIAPFSSRITPLDFSLYFDL